MLTDGLPGWLPPYRRRPAIAPHSETQGVLSNIRADLRESRRSKPDGFDVGKIGTSRLACGWAEVVGVCYHVTPAAKRQRSAVRPLRNPFDSSEKHHMVAARVGGDFPALNVRSATLDNWGATQTIAIRNCAELIIVRFGEMV